MLKGKVALNFENCLAPALAYSNIDLIKSVFKTAKFDGMEGPENEASEYVPKPEDYIYVPFRFLTSTIVGGYSWKATDFTDTAVLKKSVGMLKNKVVYLDHATGSVKNNVGVIIDAFWSKEYTASDGTVVPAGIDGVIRIDAKSNEKLARDLKGNPPSIQSCSVTVVYQYKPSHVFKRQDGSENPYEFEWRVGQTIDSESGESEMVRRICTEIEDYLELSLVSLGADPFAKIKDENGELLNIDKSAIVSNSKFSDDPEEGNISFNVYISNKIYFEKVSLTDSLSIHLAQFYTETPVQTDMEKKFQEALAKALKLKVEDVTPDLLSQYSFIKTEELNSLNGSFSTATESNKTLTAQVVSLKKDLTEKESTILATTDKLEKAEAKIVELKAFEDFKKESIAALRASILEANTKINLGKRSEAFEKLIGKADEEELRSMAAEYGVSLVEKFGGAKCNECGSTNCSFGKAESGHGLGSESGAKSDQHIGVAFQ